MEVLIERKWTFIICVHLSAIVTIISKILIHSKQWINTKKDGATDNDGAGPEVFLDDTERQCVCE